MLDLIASLLVRGLSFIFYLTPIRFNLWFGRCLGTLVYYLSGKRRRITYANLKAAFYDEKSPKEIKRITKDVYKHAAQTFAELVSMMKVDKGYVDKYIKITNFERIERAAKNPKGMILASAHFSNWEMSTAASAIKGFPLYSLARDQKMVRLNDLLNRLREAKGNKVVRKGMDIKKIFKVLKDGESIGLLADQNAGANGGMVNFFGRPASTVTGPFRFAQKSGAWVLPAFIHRVDGPYQEVVLEKPMEIGKTDDITPFMQEYNDLLEKHIRNYPCQWFWMHKRWKVTPLKKILVLDDGKKGHLKQSLAVVKQIRRYREAEGFAPKNMVVDVVKVRFKSKTVRTIFNALSPLFGPYCQGRPGLLKWALDEESYKTAINRYADVVISCGSALVGVNKVLKAENYARNVLILDPGKASRKKANLVVIPRHDVDASHEGEKNVVVTDLAPNLIDPKEINSFRGEEMKAFGEKKNTRSGVSVGLLFGGDNPHFKFGEDLTRSVADGIKRSIEGSNGSVYVTTSRRTSPEAESILKDVLGNDPGCLKFVSGKEDTDEHTVEKILAASDVVVVSGESISMVSEAVSSGKPVIVFMPEKRVPKHTKYERFTLELKNRGFISLIDPGQIPGEVERISGEKKEPMLPEDDKRILENMYKLF